MQEGFAVQPAKLTEFIDQVASVAANYATINEQLTRAQLNELGDLLGTPANLGPSGPPVDFTKASEQMLTNLASMLAGLRTLHAAIGARFDHMRTALGETRDSYARMDNDRARVFDGLLGDRSSDGS